MEGTHQPNAEDRVALRAASASLVEAVAYQGTWAKKSSGTLQSLALGEMVPWVDLYFGAPPRPGTPASPSTLLPKSAVQQAGRGVRAQSGREAERHRGTGRQVSSHRCCPYCLVWLLGSSWGGRGGELGTTSPAWGGDHLGWAGVGSTAVSAGCSRVCIQLCGFSPPLTTVPTHKAGSACSNAALSLANAPLGLAPKQTQGLAWYVHQGQPGLEEKASDSHSCLLGTSRLKDFPSPPPLHAWRPAEQRMLHGVLEVLPGRKPYRARRAA